MCQTIQMRKLLYVIAFSLIIIPSCDLRKSYNSSLFAIGVILLGSMSISTWLRKFDLKITKTGLKIGWIWIFLLVSLLPAYMVGNITINIMLKKAIIFFLYFILLSTSDIGMLELFLSGVIVNIYISYRCFFEIGVSTLYYQGTMVNPNQMALILMGGALGAMYLITSFRGIFRILGLFTFIITMVLLFYTSSRTVMMTLMLLYLLYIIYYVKVKKNINLLVDSKMSKTFFVISSVTILMAVFLVMYYRANIYKFIFGKWGNGINRLLSGRTEIWKEIFLSISLTGNYQSSINSNNDFLDWLVKYGIISFVIYIIFIVTICFTSLKRFFNNKNNENIWILIVIFGYLCICMFENLHAIFGKSINIMFWSSIGFLMRKEIISEMDFK